MDFLGLSKYCLIHNYHYLFLFQVVSNSSGAAQDGVDSVEICWASINDRQVAYICRG